MVQLHEYSRSTRKALPIGLASTRVNCQRHQCQPRWGRLNWMSCTLSLARKKRNLRFDGCGSRYALCFELGCGSRKNFTSLASLLGTHAASNAVITLMLFLFMILCTMVHLTKWGQTNWKPTLSRLSMQIYATTWNDLLASPGVFQEECNLWIKT